MLTVTLYANPRSVTDSSQATHKRSELEALFAPALELLNGDDRGC